jgi:serine/threonine protein kinase
LASSAGRSAAPASADAEVPALWRVGDVIAGQYRVTRIHEHGGMGLVYRARHLGWDTDLAVKCPRPELFASAADQERFVAEAEAWVSLGLHPNICACHYVRVLGGIPRVFAEYVEGGSLREWIDDGRLYAGRGPAATARILDVAIQTAWGLHHAHERGLVHQDVKPANVLIAVGVDGSLTAKVTDFGLARARASVTPTAGSAAATAAEGVSVLVPSGGLTRAYASPEQTDGRPLGRRSDVFSFAASVLELFTGGVVWMFGPAAGEALAAIRAEGVGDERLPDLPSDLADLLARCLEMEPSQRPASLAVVADELAEVYRRVIGTEYPRPRPRVAELRADELNNRALSLLDLGRPFEAEQTFTAAHAADPQHVDASYNLGLLRWRRGAVTDEELLAEIEAVGSDTGNPWTARLQLARVHLERGDLGSARGLLDGIQRERQGRDGVADALAVITSGTLPEAKSVQRWEIPWYWTKPEWSPPILKGRLTEALDRALIANVDDSVRIYDIRSGQCLRTLDGRAHDADMTPDGAFAVTGAWRQRDPLLGPVYRRVSAYFCRGRRSGLVGSHEPGRPRADRVGVGWQRQGVGSAQREVALDVRRPRQYGVRRAERRRSQGPDQRSGRRHDAVVGSGHRPLPADDGAGGPVGEHHAVQPGWPTGCARQLPDSDDRRLGS